MASLIVSQRTVKFINGDASSIHGSLKVGSIYTSESGEWKLGGFEVLSSIKDDESIIYVSLSRYHFYTLELNYQLDLRKSGARLRSICAP